MRSAADGNLLNGQFSCVRSWAWSEVKWHLWNHKSDQLCCAIGGNVENVFALLQQMVAAFYSSVSQKTD